MREKILFDRNWRFHKGDIDIKRPYMKGPIYTSAKTERAKWGPACRYYDDASNSFAFKGELPTERWDTVCIPHDYLNNSPVKPEYNNALGYVEYENGWYRNRFFLDESDMDKRIVLYFEGVFSNATVWVNGSLMAHNFCGYTSFEVDCTDVVRFDEPNIVAVYVKADSHEGWWYEGAGITRPVWLIKTAMVSVDTYGVYIHPECTGKDWEVPVEVTVRNDSAEDKEVCVITSIIAPSGKTVGTTENDLTVPAKDKVTSKSVTTVFSPRRWDIDDPVLYKAVTQIVENGQTVDTYETDFGFRTIRYDADKGFFLNDRHVKLKGVCCHHDFGITGRAVPDSICRHRVKLLKQMGANAYRTAHYPHSEATMDALDREGILVMDETRWFESTKEGLEQLEMLIKRDRNRPCVIMWSMGNEEPLSLTHVGTRIMQTMKAHAKRLDSTRPVTMAVDGNPRENLCFETSDIIGINYNLDHYDEVHEKFPGKAVFASECAATGTTRGYYYENDISTGHIPSYDHDANHYFLAREKTWQFMDKREWVCGAFQWTGIEYRGESLWPRLCSQSGALDMFLNKKDAFYQNLSYWSEDPMIHLLPHWNHPGHEGQLIDVWAYTNCDEAELFVDGVSAGVRKIERCSHAEWQVEYHPGTIEVVGRKNGSDVVCDRHQTTGKATALGLRLENGPISSDGRDTALITCFCLDENGNEVPDASPTVSFRTNDKGSILGTGSDAGDHNPPCCHDRRMHAGLCSLAVRAGEKGGTLSIYAYADGLEPCRLDIELQEVAIPPVVSAYPIKKPELI